MAEMKRSKGVSVRKSISGNSTKRANVTSIASPKKIVPYDRKTPYTEVEKAIGVKIDREQTPYENVLRLYNMMQYTGRTTVGSRNPYAAVEHELGITIDWAGSKPAAVKRLLEKGKSILRTTVRKEAMGGKK